MILASLLHLSQLRAVELMPLDSPPVISGGIRREAGCYGSVGPDDDVVLAGAAVPISEAQTPALIAHNTGHARQQVVAGRIDAPAIAIPAHLARVVSG